ncbi:MAG: GNAT family N-acetyltransferase [Bacteroidota bacterium]
MLETGRLILEPFRAEDVNLLHRIFTDPYVRKFLWDDEIIEFSETQNFIEGNEKYFRECRWGLWKIIQRKSSRVIGLAGLWPFFEEPQPQLIYGLFPEFTGMGYATEASKEVIDFAFNLLGFTYIMASMDEGHLASRKVMERLGMDLVSINLEYGRPTHFYRLKRYSSNTVSNLN